MRHEATRLRLYAAARGVPENEAVYDLRPFADANPSLLDRVIKRECVAMADRLLAAHVKIAAEAKQ